MLRWIRQRKLQEPDAVPPDKSAVVKSAAPSPERLLSASKRLNRQLTKATQRLPLRRVRVLWFRTKRSLGLPTRSDRAFLATELGRYLKKGRINRNIHIMADGKIDGAGSQAMAKLSAMALARKYGITYVHAPFRAMAHAEDMTPVQWAKTWENLFNLGHGELAEEHCHLPRIRIEEFISNRQLWRDPYLIVSTEYKSFTDRYPASLAAIADEIRSKYELNATARHRSNHFTVCAHLRRGDVSAENPKTAHRAPNLVALIRTLRHVQHALKNAGIDARYVIYSQGSKQGLEPLQELGCEFELNMPALATFEAFVDADILIMGRSSFSYVAALFNAGLCIYEPLERPPVPGWLVRDSNGNVDREALANGIARATARR